MKWVGMEVAYSGGRGEIRTEAINPMLVMRYWDEGNGWCSVELITGTVLRVNHSYQAISVVLESVTRGVGQSEV